MRIMVMLNDYIKEIKCIYKNESYSVRDNGAVIRYQIEGKRPRPTDNNWTFGKLNGKTGYLEISSVRIHRIVATAFHGLPPTKEHVVDHIDTNKQNNRPDNLRWVTRLENILLNPITAKRIEIVCGSVEAFLADPSKFRDSFQEPKYEWMFTVSLEEAKASKEKLLAWAKSDNNPSGGSLGKWIYNRRYTILEEKPELTLSLTPSALQKNWKTPSEFPCCPNDEHNTSIIFYEANLKQKLVFSKNQYSSSIVEDFAISNDKTVLWVLCRNIEPNTIKPYSLAEITIVNNHYVHFNLGSFFQKEGAEKGFILAQGLEWTGGETFDDFC